MTLPPSIAARSIVCDDRPSWLAARGIGGSDVAAILGRGAFGRTAWDVWVARQPNVEQIDPELQTDDVRSEGLRFERYIADEYTAHTGRAVQRTPYVVVQHAEFPWATCSPDGLAFPNPIERLLAPTEGGLEIKTDRDGGHGWGTTGTVVETSADARSVIAHGYDTQAYWTLEVTGLPWLDFAVWVPRPWGFPELRVIRVLADHAHQRRLLAQVARWRWNHLVGPDAVEPATDGSPAERRWRDRKVSPKREVREPTEREAEIVALLAWHREQGKAHDAAVRELEVELAALFGDHTYGVRLPGLKCLRTRGKSAAKVDIDRVRRERPDLIKSEGREFHRFNLYPTRS